MKVEIEVKKHVEQILDGIQYKGYIEIAGTKFNYDLMFSIALSLLLSYPEVTEENVIRYAPFLVVRKDGEKIELTNEEYEFFSRIIVKFVLDFYRSLLARGKGKEATAPEISTPLTASSRGWRNFSLQERTILNRPKFGCALPV